MKKLIIPLLIAIIFVCIIGFFALAEQTYFMKEQMQSEINVQQEEINELKSTIEQQDKIIEEFKGIIIRY
ncbi:MAG: hypothetical protein K0R54_718 [Clostridiaceae bacterium]|nr:hypothetical protein [Clostridiaceae bacterium]